MNALCYDKVHSVCIEICLSQTFKMEIKAYLSLRNWAQSYHINIKALFFFPLNNIFPRIVFEAFMCKVNMFNLLQIKKVHIYNAN